jgi:hypothetical protein
MLREHKVVPEIPKSQRYADHPFLEKLFAEKAVRDKQKRAREISEAVEKNLYRKREISFHLEMHFTCLSTIINGRGRCYQ